MTFAEMRAETFRRLREAASAPVFWTVDEVDTALNDGYAELSDASEWYEQVFDITLLNDRPYYDLRTVLGPDFLAIKPAFDVQTNRWLLPTSVRQFDAHDRRWEHVTGEPQRLLLHGLWWLGFWPRVQADTGGLIKQYYTALPPPMVEDDDEPGFPDPFHDGCIDYALADLWAQDAQTSFALIAWASYLQAEADLVGWVDDRAKPALRSGFGRGGTTGLAS